MSASTKYRNSPLAYVIFQVLHPAAPPLTRGEEAGLKQALIKVLALQTNETHTELDVVGAVGGGQPKTQVRTEPVVRYSTRDKRTAATFMTTSITIETSRYETWEQFSALVKAVLAARMDIAPVDGVERIGLRYIDEIRIPGDESPQWSQWVNPALAPPPLNTSPGLQVHQQQATIQYLTTESGVTLALRYGALVGGSTVAGSTAQPPAAPEGPFFVIDTDAAWAPGPGEEVPILEPGVVMSSAGSLHGFVKELFEAALTDRLRTEVFDAQD